MTDTHLAEVFPAGEYLADELETLGWSYADFADIIDRPTQLVSDIVNGKKEITRATAAQIATALGTSPELWLNLQNVYLLHEQNEDPEMAASLSDVERRARLRTIAPIRLLVNRGYVRDGSPEEQEQDIRALLGSSALDGDADIQFAARRSNEDENVSTRQRSWAACVRIRARDIEAATYDRAALGRLAESLTHRLRELGALADFQREFAEVGVRLVYVESFPHSKLDGCAFIDEGTPVIGLSGRGKRLDKVFFTLMHEVAHLLLEHVGGPDQALIEQLGSDDPQTSPSTTERAADSLAADLILPSGTPERTGRINRRWIDEHAQALNVAPIVLIGRLQNEGILPWTSTLSRTPPNATEYLAQWT
ncbi:HigA family addiction module antitoxin [Corynebacterium sp. AOP40-9SA-29]|uniref:HigA family addiction module antitoxin n=1 Tax=Corynebacterium sp. AOP40-9SA-29 TaxID=3457677 RepID=UPI00403469BD